VTPAPRGGIIQLVRSADALAAALGYAHRGWFVLPLHWAIDGLCSCGQADCESPAEHPCTEHGLDDASTDPDTVRKWWRLWPEANIGIRMGKGLLALEVSRLNGGDETLRDLERDLGRLPDTVTVLTGDGGECFIFTVTQDFDKVYAETRAIGPGLNVRWNGGYIAAPPSRHISGRPYEWEIGHGPDDIPLTSLPEVHAGYLAALRENHLEDLRKSGLSHSTIEQLGFFSVTPQMVNGLLRRTDLNSFGLVIQYPRVPIQEYVRVKLDNPPLDSRGKPIKYMNPPGAMPRAYIPPQTAEAIKRGAALLITEGEKKAAKADQDGFPCIGIGGVWNFKQKRGGLIPDLAEIHWSEKGVWLVYDDDYHVKTNVQQAAQRLACELTARGALVYVVPLPEGGAGDKVGLDDFLVANGKESLWALLYRAKPFVDSRAAGRRGTWLAKGAQRGYRHAFLGYLALKMRHEDWPKAPALAVLRAINANNKAKSRLPNEEIDAVAWLWNRRAWPKYPLGGVRKGVVAVRTVLSRPKLEACQFLLRTIPQEGRIAAEDAYDAAERKGISRKTLERAKDKMKVKSIQEGRKWWWEWETPPGAAPAI